MVKQIIGGVVVLVIGGSTYAVSQTDVVNNFSKNSGMTQQQAQQYVNSIPKSDMASFSVIGKQLASDGNSILTEANGMDCVNYSYKWESPSLSCNDGQTQLQKVGNDEITLGNCLESLDSNLGSSGKNKISECISDIDTSVTDYDLPIVPLGLDSNTITDSRNTDIYNKSVLEAALKAN